jgi:NodT family efflux transporter outer membrane factor (OMF) lipoprotein
VGGCAALAPLVRGCAALAPLVGGCAALAVLSGCAAVGPDFKAPPPPTSTGYLPASETARTARDTARVGPPAQSQSVALGETVTAAWWTLFRSPQLDGLVRDAIAGNRSLESARQRLIQAREVLTQARGALYPQASLGAAETEEKVSAAAFGLSPQVFPLPPNFNLFQVGPTASYALDLFGGTRRQIERSAALAEYQADQLDGAYMTLTGDAVTEALEIAALRAELDAVEDILAIDRQNAELVSTEGRVGEAPESDLVIARGEVAADETLKPALEQQLSVARHALAVLTGRAPGDFSPPDFDISALTLPDSLPVSLPSELVHRRPDIMAAEAELHAASAAVGVATAQLYPAITLTASGEASALNGGALFSTDGLVWSVAAGITQPVFDGGVRRAQRRAALAAFKASAADYQQTVLAAFGQVADLLQALSHDADLVAGQQRSLDLAAESVRLQRIAYTRGGSGVLSLLDAERQYQRARLGFVQAQGRRYLDTAQLLVAMGGGWWGGDSSPAAAAAKFPLSPSGR